MNLTIPTYIRRLCKEYYEDHGEKCRVAAKIHRTIDNGFDSYEEYAYVCRVEANSKKKNYTYTVVTEKTGAHSETYISEDMSNDNYDVLVDSWVKEFEEELYE